MADITWTTYLEAGVQDKVAEFLALKSKLISLQNHSNINIAKEAKSLYNDQLSLEAELPEKLAMITKAQEEGWRFIYLAYLGTFAKKFKSHLEDSKDLIKAAKSTMTAAVWKKDSKIFTYVKYGAGGIVGFVLMKKLLK